ncbi:hypothetical protein BBNG_00362 [Bifidobacterium bifidum NCIMB 41171]|nr:hypothetical protein BBNG_00362 [Bifidobacterium bifidum NCIMB 41171]
MTPDSMRAEQRPTGIMHDIPVRVTSSTAADRTGQGGMRRAAAQRG